MKALLSRGDESSSLLRNLTAGCISGAVAAAATNPLDLIKACTCSYGMHLFIQETVLLRQGMLPYITQTSDWQVALSAYLELSSLRKCCSELLMAHGERFAFTPDPSQQCIGCHMCAWWTHG